MLDAGLSSTAAHGDSAEFDSGEYKSRPTDELEAEITELCAHIDAATYRLLRAIAESGTTEHVESDVRGCRRAVRGEGLEEARRHREARYLEMYPDDDGMVVIRGRLPQEVAAPLEKALQAAMDALRDEAKEEDRVHQQRNEKRNAAARDSAGNSAPSVISATAGIPQSHGQADEE